MILKASVLALALLAPVAFADTTFLPDSALTASTSYYTNNLGAVAMDRNDDGYSSEISLGFNFTLYGNTYNSLYINNNGNVTFNNGLSTYTPQGPTGVNVPIISTYFADVDTRGDNNGQVYYRIADDTLYVTWDNVGYYNQHTDLRDSFQLVLRGDDVSFADGEGQIGFFYKNMQWTTGDASAGSGGMGGKPAAVGFGDGLGNAQALLSSQTADINNIVANSHIWFNVNDGGVIVVPPPVPEPETWALLGFGLVGLIGRRAMKRKAA
ncbi:nidogen-like domain-containing protein [Amantichitinum ursilacus]|uniref:PEP-CTERM motif protein n=1 Tax=Amantichitinum ursilacus TaxID=857265 RepID=A0A0N0XND0_9NEIS|nr:nidogen-like domain-containing protein [Amantichitinum ursilacus]KPC55082.1 PEP-CTERM motif protein [Amantichitinum ursilacus]